MPSQVDLDDLSPNVESEGKGASTARKSTNTRAAEKKEKELAERIEGCFERIAGALETRGDEQMADILREDAAIMSQGLVYLTRPLAMLRAPLVAGLAIVEPLLAFGRILRLSAERMAERRAERAEEREREREHAAEVAAQ